MNRRIESVGFTGTQVGMTSVQLQSFYALLQLIKSAKLHHGDCIGADAQVHDIAVELEMSIVIHPPLDERKRAFKWSDLVRPARAYLDRNHDIVDESDVLIATPKESLEVLRSGTWATIRYAYKQGKTVLLILPDGRLHSLDSHKKEGV